MYVRQIEIFPREQRGNLAKSSSGMERQGDQDTGGTITKLRELPHFKVGNYVLMAEFDDGDEFFREKARRELRETDEVVQEALKEIRELVRGEPDLHILDDDEYYQKFLRPCKWYPKSALKLMKRFYQYRLAHPRYSENLIPSNEKNILASEILIPLPERSVDGCRVLVLNAGKKWNTKLISIDEIFRGAMLSLDAAMAEPKTQIAGAHVILNMEGLTLTHVTHFTPSFAGSVAEWVQNCLPCRLKGIHIINQPFIFNMIFALFKPFLLEKTRKRIFFHGTDRKALISHVGAKCLPTEFGGEFEMPKSPIGDCIWNYFCWFDKDFEVSNQCGYTKSAKR